MRCVCTVCDCSIVAIPIFVLILSVSMAFGAWCTIAKRSGALGRLYVN
jgi:hypothetical protein